MANRRQVRVSAASPEHVTLGSRRAVRPVVPMGPEMLLDRHAERAVLDRLLDAARGGRSGVLVVRGEAGVGKTALLDYAVQSAAGMRIARLAGVESEMELSFAALQPCCLPILALLERLPDPQRAALGAALSLLSETTEEQPLLCVIDDAQWLDRASAQAVGFVARRMLAEPVALVIAEREPGEHFRGLPELLVEGLGHDDARELLGSVMMGPLDERVRERIVAETRGNPLALLELPRGLTPAELAGGFGLPGAVPLAGSIEESFRRRADALPPQTRRLLVLAAADPTGDPALVWRAAARLRIRADAAAPAADAGLAEFSTWVRFRHPLARSAAYRLASLRERQQVHRALAEATDPAADPDRRAWHRAQAAPGPAEDIATELEQGAARAQRRGGLAAAATFLERAAMLTPDPARRVQRLLAAARANREAGALDAALGLLVAAEAGPEHSAGCGGRAP